MTIQENTVKGFTINGNIFINIVLFEDSNSFDFLANGDRGSYEYYWGSPGCDWREFLSKLEYDYFFNKTKGSNGGYIVDVELSAKEIQRQAIESLKESNSYSKRSREEIDVLREFFNELRDLKAYQEREGLDILMDKYYNDISNFVLEDMFSYEYRESMMVYSKDAQCLAFWEILQEFLGLQKEKEVENG